MIAMSRTRTIAYTEWLKYVRASYEKGRHCSEFKELQCVSPLLSGAEYENYVQNELARLETRLIKAALEDFQALVNRSLEEADIYILERGIRQLKESVDACVFFDGMEGCSAEMKNSLKESIRRNFILFTEEFARYIKGLTESERGPYVDEVIYTYKKAKIKNFILERTYCEK